MISTIELGDISVEVIKKDIRNVHLSVYPPAGRVRISAPLRMDKDTIRVFAIAKLGWIRKQQKKLKEQERESEREYLNRESHYVWGKRYLLRVVERDETPSVELKHSVLVLNVRPGASEAKKQEVLERWYREQIRKNVPRLIAKWERVIGVNIRVFYVQRMKTKWGSCSALARTIRLNSELAKKPRECLEYIVVHEMVHLRERTHNRRFRSLMEQFMPRWESHRELLNRLPVRREKWVY
jgi:predicted metal-dependent hydrolase